MLPEIVVLVVLIVFSGVFSATETAYTSLSIVQIQRLYEKKGQRGRMVQHLTKRSDVLLGTILICNNLTNIGASALATKLTIEVFGSHVIGITTGVLTLTILVFGEITPKRIAIIKNEALALRTARLITVLSWVLRPVILVISFVSNLVTALLKSDKNRGLTLEGILHMVSLAENLGVVKSYETSVVKNILKLSDIPIQSILTHRTDVYSLDKDSQIRQVIGDINKKGFSRIPVYDDHPENITGIVLLQDVLDALAKGNDKLRLQDIAIKPLIVPSSRKAQEVFNIFRRQELNMAIVFDEYGGLAGIVTREDIVEEILGELYDEYERREQEKIVKLDDNQYRIFGDAPFHLLEDKLKLKLNHSKQTKTIGGFFVESLGRIPLKEDSIPIKEGLLKVERIQKNKIISLLFIENNETEDPTK